MGEISGLDHVRKRPGMYIGGTGRDGLAHLVMEVVSNSFDLVLGGAAATITVSLGRDGSITVLDDGPGMVVLDRRGPSFEELFTTLRRTPTADGHFPHAHLAIGVGLGPVCALSAELDVTSHREEATYRQSFARGEATGPLRREDPSGPTGTTVRLLPDTDVFEVAAIDATDLLADELRQIAFLQPGLVTRLEVEGEEPVTFGPVDDLRPLFEHTFLPRSPEDRPLAVLSAATGDFVVDAVLDLDSVGWEMRIEAFGNFRHLVEPDRVHQGVTEGLRAVLGPGPMDDVEALLDGVVHVQLLDPRFPGPTGRRLASPEAIWCVADTIAAQLPAYLARHPDLEARLRSRVPTRENVDAGGVVDRWSLSDG